MQLKILKQKSKQEINIRKSYVYKESNSLIPTKKYQQYRISANIFKNL